MITYREGLARALVLIADEWGYSLEQAVEWLNQEWSFADDQVEPSELERARELADTFGS